MTSRPLCAMMPPMFGFLGVLGLLVEMLAFLFLAAVALLRVRHLHPAAGLAIGGLALLGALGLLTSLALEFGSMGVIGFGTPQPQPNGLLASAVLVGMIGGPLVRALALGAELLGIAFAIGWLTRWGMGRRG